MFELASSARRQRRLWVACGILLGIAVAVAFQPAFTAGFVDWDDDRNFLENTRFRGFGAANLAWMATSFHLGHYQPLAWLTLAADHALHGLDPRGYHRTSIAIHALGALAFLFVARALFTRLRPAWSPVRAILAATAAALLFAVHPLRCESVCWITERRDVLSGLFFVLSVGAWLRFLEGGGRRAYWIALAFQVVSLQAKAWAVVLPGVFCVLDRAVGRGPDSSGAAPKRVNAMELLPSTLVSLAFSVLAVHAARSGTQASATLAQHGVVDRLVQGGYALLFYPWKTLAPFDLSPLYPLPPAGAMLRPEYLIVAAGGALLGLVLWSFRRRAPLAWWSWLAFAIPLAPVSGVLQVGPQLVADRYSYLACLPFALLGAGALFDARFTLVRSTAIASALVVVLVAMTREQSRVWHDDASLWARAYAHSPTDPTVLDHMARVHVRIATGSDDPSTKRAGLALAERFYDEAWRATGNPLHLVNLGGIERVWADCDPDHRAEHLASALRTVERALVIGRETKRVRPGWLRTHAALLADLGRDDEAVKELDGVVRDAPGDKAARRVLAEVLERLGRWPDALVQRQAVVDAGPEDAEAWLALGSTHERMGELDRARVSFETALERARRADDARLATAATDALARTSR